MTIGWKPRKRDQLRNGKSDHGHWGSGILFPPYCFGRVKQTVLLGCKGRFSGVQAGRRFNSGWVNIITVVFTQDLPSSKLGGAFFELVPPFWVVFKGRQKETMVEPKTSFGGSKDTHSGAATKFFPAVGVQREKMLILGGSPDFLDKLIWQFSTCLSF